MKRISDSQQRLMVALAFVLEFYKVMMGSMLTVFVPQRCGTAASPDDVCSVSEIAAQLASSGDATQRAAFVMNLSTLLVVVFMYGFEAYRENWCIENLDIDPSKPETHLDAELAAWPELRKTGLVLNARYSRMSGIAAAVVAGNFSLSSVFLLAHQAGLATLISLLSYLLLLAIKLHSTYRIAHASLRDAKTYSAYMVSQRVFNCVDEDVVASARAAPPAVELSARTAV